MDRSNLYNYQRHAIDFILEKKKCGLFLGMGLGKTIIALTSVKDLIDKGKAKNALVIAPLRVANGVWREEAREWQHTRNLNIQVCTGRNAKNLDKEADIHIINRDITEKTIKNYEDKWKWDILIIDESTSFKNPQSKRFRSLKRVLLKFNYIVILSGTPSANSMVDLWAQIFILDQGVRLFRYITYFKTVYFTNWGTKKIPKLFLKNNSLKYITDSIQDICISMKTTDYVDMPRRLDLYEKLDMPTQIQNQYKELQKDFVLQIKDETITSVNAAALAGKLLQFCNGAVYNKRGEYVIVHDVKINALHEIVDANPDEKYLVFYNFKSDCARIMQKFPEAVKLSKSATEVTQWNEGKIQMLLCHPQSGGHGLNLQYGGNIIVWFGMNWSSELYTQANARLWRRGQKNDVRIIHLVINGGMDQIVLKALALKSQTNRQLLDSIRIIIKDQEKPLDIIRIIVKDQGELSV